jgi:hypothetical protein
MDRQVSAETRGFHMYALLRPVTYSLKRTVGRYPPLYFPLFTLRRQNRTLAVTASTDLVIEGYPRSANTFAVAAFEQAQPGAVRVAHHLHVPAQVIRAAHLGVPALVLIRNPRDAILSFLVRDPGLGIRQAIRWYIAFHEALEPYRESFVLATFEDVTRDFGEVIHRINARFASRFAPFVHSETNLNRVFATIDELNRRVARGGDRQVARPTASRESHKRRLEPGLETGAARSLLARAGAVFDRLRDGPGRRRSLARR